MEKSQHLVVPFLSRGARSTDLRGSAGSKRLPASAGVSGLSVTPARNRVLGAAGIPKAPRWTWSHQVRSACLRNLATMQLWKYPCGSSKVKVVGNLKFAWPLGGADERLRSDVGFAHCILPDLFDHIPNFHS